LPVEDGLFDVDRSFPNGVLGQAVAHFHLQGSPENGVLFVVCRVQRPVRLVSGGY